MTQSPPDVAGSRAELLARPSIFAPILLAVSLGLSLWLAGRGIPTDDEGAVLALAGRILDGDVFYRDLDAYYLPGAIYLLAGWMALVGEHLNAARWLAAIVFSGMVMCLYASALKLTDVRRAALVGLGLLSFKCLAAPAFTAYTYADLSLCFAAGAIALMLRHTYEGPSRHLVAIGVLLALSTTAKQNLGIYATGTTVLLVLLAPRLLGVADAGLARRARSVGVLMLGYALVSLPVLGYFAAQGLLGQLVASGLMRPLLEYLPSSSISYWVPLEWWRLGSLRDGEAFPYFLGRFWAMLMNDQMPVRMLYPVYWLFGELFTRVAYTVLPLAFGILGWRWLSALRAGHFEPIEVRRFTFTALAGAVVLSAFPRADFYHVMGVYPVVFLLLIILGAASRITTDQSVGNAPSARGLAIAVALLLAVTSTLAWAHQRLKTHRMQIERADLMIEPSKAWIATVVEYIERSQGEGDRLFVYGNSAYYYFLTDRYYPWPFVQVYPGMVGGERGRGLALNLLHQPASLILKGVMGWPGMPAIPSYAQALNHQVQIRYPAYQGFFDAHLPPGGHRPPEWAFEIRVPRGDPAGARSR